jgi:predicted amidophosphoribosyltransferase
VRQLERARHPAQALARELAVRWGLDCEPLLVRTRVTERQAALPLALRRGNVHNVFAPTREIASRVLLVDDVYTSGSTANAAASALRRGGAARVEVMTFARALR